MKIAELYDLTRTLAGEYLKKFTYPFEAVAGIKDFIWSLGPTLQKDYKKIADGVWVHESATVAPSAYTAPPCIIGENSEVRHCAYIRGGVLIGKGCVAGNSTELKNCILFDGVQVPHYNYVGDAILGFRAHMGAGAIISNVRSDKMPVKCICGGVQTCTGLKKLGAMLGDGAEIGCGSVLNPGTVIGKNTIVYPLSRVRGEIPADSIYKGEAAVVKRL